MICLIKNRTKIILFLKIAKFSWICFLNWISFSKRNKKHIFNIYKAFNMSDSFSDPWHGVHHRFDRMHGSILSLWWSREEQCAIQVVSPIGRFHSRVISFWITWQLLARDLRITSRSVVRPFQRYQTQQRVL